ncbi:hypothetical protein [Bremerella cremea]|uniref:hypothetical protein n=1 Tax=Bremerella cremea TaxID=1031537 RepID=UPI0031EDC930
MNVAAAWPVEIEYPQMANVSQDDFVMMWAKGKGVVGIGIADSSPFEILDAGSTEQIWEIGMRKEKRANSHHLDEWRVRISRWLFWDANTPFKYKGQQRAFDAANAAEVDNLLRQVTVRIGYQ